MRCTGPCSTQNLNYEWPRQMPSNGRIRAPTSIYLERAWTINIVHFQVHFCMRKLLNTSKSARHQSRSTFFPLRPVWVGDHVHHHFLWWIFPVAKSCEINLKEKKRWGSYAQLDTLTVTIHCRGGFELALSSTFLRCPEKISSLFLYTSCWCFAVCPPSPHTSTPSIEATTGK